MYFNNTTFTNQTLLFDTEYNSKVDEAIVLFCSIYLLIGAVTSFFTFSFGILSWVVLKKWRQFKNYVFLTIVSCYTILYIFFMVIKYQSLPDNVEYCIDKIIYFFIDAFSCWLFLSTMMIYLDVVKVFKPQITRKFLKYNIFGWGLPLVDTILKIVADYNYIDLLYYMEQNEIMVTLLLLINFVMYLIVLCKLSRTSRVRRSPSRGYKIQTATVTFFMSGIFLLLAVLVLAKDPYMVGLLPGTLFITQTMVVNIFFLLLKSSRLLWREYFKRLPTVV